MREQLREEHLERIGQALAGVFAELRRLVMEAYVMACLPRLYEHEELVDQLLQASLLALELGGIKPEEAERQALAEAMRAYIAAPLLLTELAEVERPAHPLDDTIERMWQLAHSRIPQPRPAA